METVFLKILNMSVNAGWLVLAVLVLRLLLKKAPKAITVLMWALVGVRLLCPFSLESALSLLPSGETVPEQFLSTEAEQITIHMSGQIDWTQPAIDSVTVPAPETGLPSDPSLNLTQVAALVWLAGVALMLLYAAFSYLRVRRRVREGMHLRDRLWLCDRISSPFILGIIRPRIYLPSAMAPADLEYVIAHENAHLRRKDHWWKPLGFLLLCVYWFNPLLWVGYLFLCRDIEFACDEAVLRQLGSESKKPYSEALLNCSISRRALTACPLAFGEVGVKSRIKSVLSYKKPTLWIILAAVLTCIAVAVCFLTDPKTEMSPEMDLTVRNLISSHHRSDESADRACCCEYELLGMKQRGRTTTLYLSVMYEEYTLKDGELYGETGSHIPTVITLTKKDGEDTMKEYWEPRDGSYYPKDIRKKFPIRLWDKALNTHWYAEKLQRSCEEQARAKLKYSPSQFSSETQEQEYWEYLGLPTSKTFDIDGDGIEESCTLGPGQSAEHFSFTLSVFEKGIPEYYNEFAGSFHYLSFGTDPEGRDCLVARTREPDSETGYFYFEVKDGNIEIYGRGCSFVHSGKQGIPYTPWQVTSDLDLAISRAVRLCHTSDQTEGDLYTQSYVVLEQERLSGTPLFGENNHHQETKVYLMVMEMQYSVENGALQRVCASIHPTVITFAMEEEQLYALQEYDNAGLDYYAALAKFTPTAAAAAKDVSVYGGGLEDACNALAEQLLQLQNTLGTADDGWIDRYYRTMRSFPE